LNFYYDGTNCYWNIGQGYGTAATSSTTNLASSVTGTLAVANGGTGATTLTGLVKGNGTGAMTAATAGTDYLAPSGSAASLTNFPTLNQNTTGTATNVTGTVAVANGGTGSTSLSANNVLLGNGTSALQVVAPGTSGNVLTSNGTTWSSSAPTASGVPYTGATGSVDLGAYDLTVNGLTVGKGKKDAGTAYQYNSAFGVSALGSFSGGTKNTALGYNALSSVTSTDQNIAIGAYAMGSTTDYFQQSVAVGNQSLQYNKGSFNTALGSGALSGTSLTSAATYLVGVGALALMNNTSGQNNTAVGSYALSTNTTGNNNTALGQGADVSSAALDNATAIGYNAKVSSSNSIQLGDTSITNVKTSGTVTAGTVTYPNTHGTANQVLSTTGSGTLTWSTPSSGVPYSGATGPVNLGAYNLTVSSFTIGQGKTPASGDNLAIGRSALNNTTGNGWPNIGLGSFSLNQTTDGKNNIGLGLNALYANTTGSANIGIGSEAARNAATSSNITAVGMEALKYETGAGNTALGSFAGKPGNSTVYSATTNSTFLGYNTTTGKTTDVTITNATAIGYGATVSASNSIQLGNSSVTNVNTYGALTTGFVTYPIVHGTANQVLSTTGSGTLTWTTPTVARPTTDQFTATAAQTSFTLTQTPLNTKVWMFINGIRTNNLAYTISGTTLTYTASNNNSYTLVVGDRIQFDYAY
jgi:hypothetical protein